MYLIGANRAGEACKLGARYCDAFPEDAEGWFLLGAAHAKAGSAPESERCFRQAVKLAPETADAHVNLGNILLVQGKHDEAAASYRRALAISPSLSHVRLNLAHTLVCKKDFESAAAEIQKILAEEPAQPQANMLMGDCLRALCEPLEAVEHFRKAANAGADPVAVDFRLGLALQEAGMPREALKALDRVIQRTPDHAEARTARAILHLQLGDYPAGWSEYEWRWKLPGRILRKPGKPLWDGAALDGRAILLHPEQGLGDSIQFIRFATILKEQGATTLFVAPPPLRRLMRHCPGIDRIVIPEEGLPPFDVHLPLMSLPRVLGTTTDSIPAPVPYIRIGEDVESPARDLLAQHQAGLRVGIVWAGGETAKNDYLRSCPVEQFMKLTSVPNVVLFSLQKGSRSEQLKLADPLGKVVDLAPLLDDFVDTAAVMNQLDLIVSVDTAAAHLAGALGRPTWTLLHAAPDWRWMLDRDDTPWYPTMRLFRQTRLGDWDSLFERLIEHLAALSGKQGVMTEPPNNR